MIETFAFCDRNSCLHYGSKDILIKDVRIVWQTKDIIIYGATSSTANIKGIMKNSYISASAVPFLDTRSLIISPFSPLKLGETRKIW